MDFGAVLHTAQKNEKNGKKEGVRYYSTKFEPPKKEQRNKQLSENIKKFLAKKEAEEREKKVEALKKKEELLALRAKDKKATRRMNVMLKRTKSANQSVLQDAIDSNNTSVTLAGPIQPDEDDYGYVSQEASAFYNKMMEKYNQMPDEPKFQNSRKRVSTDLHSVREKVKAALEREKEEANNPHRRKRKLKEGEENQEVQNVAPKIKRAPAPPPINFNDLLKLAEKKQFEPIVIEQKPKEEEKLLTKKQKKEMEREKEWRESRESKVQVTEEVKRNAMKSEPKKEVQKSTKPVVVDKKQIVPSKPTLMKKDLKEVPRKKLPPVDVKPKQFPPKDLKPKQFPPADVRRKEFPPKDVRRKAPIANNKRRIVDDEEYDSELDDFIDDGPEEGEDYSKYISEIFGYDKSKYRNIDDDVDNMESTFAQQMREEIISTKIGIKEDLEDMKLEEEEKRRKALLKKKRKL